MKIANLVHSKMLHLQSLRDPKSTSGCALFVFGSHAFVPISSMCIKQTANSHSSAESEIISPDAVYAWMDYHLVNLEKVSWKVYPAKPAERNLARHTREKVTPSHSRSNTCVFGSNDNIPPNILNKSQSTQL